MSGFRKKFIRYLPIRFAGFALLEATAVVATLAVLLTTLWVHSNSFVDFNKGLATARYYRDFADAALRYWENTPTTSPVDRNTLTQSKYLPQNFPITDPYGHALNGCLQSSTGNTSNTYRVFAKSRSGPPMPIYMAKYVSSLLGPGGVVSSSGSLCGNTIFRESPAVYLSLKGRGEEQAYLQTSGAGAQMNTTLFMGGNDVKDAKDVDVQQMSADKGKVVYLSVTKDFRLDQNLSATSLTATASVTVTGLASANRVSALNITTTSRTSADDIYFIPDQKITPQVQPVKGAGCPQKGAIASPNQFDRSSGTLYCGTSGTSMVWKTMSQMNFRVVSSTEAKSTTQTAWCKANEVVVSGGGYVPGSWGEYITPVRTVTTKIAKKYDPRWIAGSTSPTGLGNVSIQEPARRGAFEGEVVTQYGTGTAASGTTVTASRDYTWKFFRESAKTYYRWKLQKTTSLNNGNVKGNVSASYPVFSGGVWGWRIQGTQAQFGNTGSSARAVCLCVGEFTSGTCRTLQEGFTRPTGTESITIAGDRVTLQRAAGWDDSND